MTRKLLEDYAPGEVCFVHIPRCAGRSICEATGIKQSHDPFWKRKIDSEVSFEYSFAVVRNPWDQVASWYVAANIEKQVGLTLSEWVEKRFPGLAGVGQTDAWFNTVHPFDQLGRCGEDLGELFEFEDIRNWWPLLSHSELPVIGKSCEYAGNWTHAAVDVVARINEELIDVIGYAPPLWKTT